MKTMPYLARSSVLAATFCLGTLLAGSWLLGNPASAHGYKLGQLEIGHPWTRATPPSARVAGGYLTITNTGSAADRLIGAEFAESRKLEIHEMAHQGSTMVMREVPRGLEIAPGQKVELKPGGFHLMFIDLKRGLKEGESIKGALVFERAGRVEVEFKVEAMGARGDAHGSHKHH
jgi:periplasmic copper chaperone A